MYVDNNNPGQAVILLPFHRLTRGHGGNQELINTVDKLVIMNSMIAIGGSIVMNHLMSYYISNGFVIPEFATYADSGSLQLGSECQLSK